MRARPRFRRYFRIEAIEGEGIYLLGEGGSHVLLGRAFLAVAPLLRGELTGMEICQRLEGRIAAEEVFYALPVLRRDGAVPDDADARPPAEAAFGEAPGRPHQAARRARRARVSGRCGYGAARRGAVRAQRGGHARGSRARRSIARRRGGGLLASGRRGSAQSATREARAVAPRSPGRCRGLARA